MLINCPKCHFRQPHDQYCASCGIDMIAFKPLPVSRSKTFFQSGFFQIFFLALIAAVLAYFIMQSDHPQNWVRKFSYAKKLNSASSESASQKNTPLENTNDEQPVQVQVVATSGDATLNQFVNPKPNLDTETVTTLKITYVEVERENLANWTAESQKQGLYQSFGDFSAGIIANYKKKLTPIFLEHKSFTKKFAIEKPEALMAGKTLDETSEFLGLQANVTVKTFENQIIKGHLDIAKISRVGTAHLPIEFELQKESLFFVNWKSAMVGFENETTLFKTPPFEILQSTNFLNQKSEFIILIEPL